MNTVPARYTYRKSRASTDNSTCVEMRNDLAAFRDSKAPQAGDLPVAAPGVRAFVAAIQGNQLHLPV
jgi:hypothetical protein